MSTSSDPSSSPRPGRKQGPTSELTTFFNTPEFRKLLEIAAG